MPHFFINSNIIINNMATISDSSNYQHIVKSLRSNIGEKLLLIDENEIQYETTISDITKRTVIAKIDNFYNSQRKLKFNLYLAQSPLKSDAQTTIVEKATELGVDIVYPIYTDNCSLKKSVIEQKISKWQSTMLAASKQCERANIPVCHNLTTLDEVFKNNKFDKIIAFCERHTNISLKEYLEQSPILQNEKVLAIIGCEGGFSQREFEYFISNSIPMVTLGDLILKAETATIVALGNIVYEF